MTGLPLLAARSRFALIPQYRMKLQFDRVPGCVSTVPLTPVIADRICKDIAVFAEGSGCDGAANLGVTFQTVLGVLVPEVESAVGAGSAKGAMLWVEGNGVYREDFGDVPRGRVLLAVAFEGEVEAGQNVSITWEEAEERGGRTWCPCLRHTEWRIVLRWTPQRSQSRPRSSSQPVSATSTD